MGEQDSNKYYYKPNNEDSGWIKTVSDSIEYINSSGKKMKAEGYSMLLWKFDCIERQIGMAQFIVYSKEGKVLHSISLKSYEIEMLFVVPDSLGEIYFNTFCNQN